MDDTEEDRSAIAHSNTESIKEETEQSRHYNTNGTPPGRTEHGSRCTPPDGEITGLRTERVWRLSSVRRKRERERNTRKRDSACPPVPEKYWMGVEREDERSSEGTNDSDSASPEWADLDPTTAAWAFDKDPGDFSGVHDTVSEDEKGRLEITHRRGDKHHTGEENTLGRDLFFAWEEHVGVKVIAAAIL
ncbi:uncharacterized protein MONOS_16304 [Monocercomonoides exilis]|uniref:uncharacterized protein n=1 Tax=Monocercomonoides exilis TaxID=2049356 RepID=UPI0035598784|nr:hypothetical protein MONOS_16304 [Monocercomonoides exilis]|eukprot:MONOS_16304.1-p1 / transcript=MONOS_16304.1 / gene=MONOS_16304 / organism=Monocercomonoides_exilis_PA203 / gene_product=unspecified product / transcript_product=unspecified product / location=Mono_scaffold01632:2173-2830(-) / protein_length=190 / sequence_SO=supercontig / SO=protein_coding / is_pseudo=false